MESLLHTSDVTINRDLKPSVFNRDAEWLQKKICRKFAFDDRVKIFSANDSSYYKENIEMIKKVTNFRVSCPLR